MSQSHLSPRGFRWYDANHAKELDAIAKRQGAREARRWAQGLATEQLVTVEWHNFWKGLSK